METYVSALIKEMTHYSQKFSSAGTVNSIFLGGGTPTTLSATQLARILEECKKQFNIAEDAEITLEANPATIGSDQLKSIRQAGYNRISIGVQSFDEEELKLLDRAHGVEEIHCTVDRARESGFSNLSLDLMFAIPDQTLDGWGNNLRQALVKKPEHLSTYNLTIEKETSFGKLQSSGKLVMPDEDHQLELFKRTIDFLKENGFHHYEISNFARPGKECRHNITYWQNSNTLGLGAGASFYMNGIRSKNTNLPTNYIREINKKHTAVEFSESLRPRQAMGETLMLGLRMLKGISIMKFEDRFQTSIKSIYGDVIASLKEKELITIEQGQLRLSKKGLFLANSVILEFI
jgi:oxygen-independent coproporphyrinogen-3 oxidase